MDSQRGGLSTPEPGTARTSAPYSLVVSSEPSTAPSETCVEQAVAHALAAFRWMRPLAVVAIGFVVVTAFQARPAPGAHGEHLAVTIALIGIAAGIAGMLRLTGAGPAPIVLMPLLVVITVSSAALLAFQPSGPGFLGVFPAVSVAALRLPARFAAAMDR